MSVTKIVQVPVADFSAPSATSPAVNVVSQLFDGADVKVHEVNTPLANAVNGKVPVSAVAPSPGVYTLKSQGADASWARVGPINVQTVDFPVTFLAVAP